MTNPEAILPILNVHLNGYFIRGGITMGHACSRKNDSAPIHELFQLTLDKNELAFIYLGYAGIILKVNDRVLAFDVGKECLRQDEIEALETLDVQLYSHTHWDHWDPSVTMNIVEVTGATIVADPSVVDEMRDTVTSDILKSATPNLSFTLNNVEISAIRGIHSCPITLFQVICDDVRIFHGADSGYVPLSKYSVDVAFIPTGNPSPSCSPENGLKMALDVQPNVVVATHGNSYQVRKFRELIYQEMPGTKVIIPKPCELVRVQVEGGSGLGFSLS
jgi:L-ascorbate metabolism protein UlaG (beta-lactamase superfamily)